jgi:hypothetical protein
MITTKDQQRTVDKNENSTYRAHEAVPDSAPSLTTSMTLAAARFPPMSASKSGAVGNKSGIEM